MISRRRLHLVIALLLPLMVLRAMLPAGFMPVAENGSLRIVLCSQVLALPDADTDHRLPGAEDCPFALAVAAPPPADSLSALHLVPQHASPDRDFHSTLAIASVHRSQSPRGPPSISQ